MPINHLVQVEGTPLHARFGGESALDPLEFVRTIAVARITMPRAMSGCRPGAASSAKRCRRCAIFAGANSIFYGDRLLTTGNPDVEADRALFDKLGLTPRSRGDRARRAVGCVDSAALTRSALTSWKAARRHCRLERD